VMGMAATVTPGASSCILSGELAGPVAAVGSSEATADRSPPVPETEAEGAGGDGGRVSR
jgi:hypothetical protein